MDADEQVDCHWIDVLPDGRVLLRIAGTEHTVDLYGVAIAVDQRAAVAELLRRIQTDLFPPLKCMRPPPRAPNQSTPVTKISYLAWRDKSGDVWEDLSAALLEEGVARVIPDEFPERADYLSRERVAREQGVGIWAPPP